MTDAELVAAMTPDEREQLLDMLDDLQSLGPKPTREAALRALLPHLQVMFGGEGEAHKDQAMEEPDNAYHSDRT